MLGAMQIDRHKFKHIIFDFDGVIAETDTARFKVISKILLKYNINLERNHGPYDLIGQTTDVFLSNNYPSLKKNEISQIVKERRSTFLSNIENSCIVFPGAVKTIHDLKNSNNIIYLATTNERFVAQKLLEHIGIINIFETCFFREDIVNKKTNKKDYGLFLSKMSIEPDELMVIEDSMIGILSAKENLLFCIAFNKNDDQRIMKIADVSIKTYADLRKILGLM